MKSRARKIIHTFSTITITLLSVVICMFFSLRFLTFRMVPLSEEAGHARWGFPAIMAESSDVFYAGWAGVPASEGGSDYIRKFLGRDWPRQDELLWKGVFINLLCFSIFGMFAAFFVNHILLRRFYYGDQIQIRSRH